MERNWLAGFRNVAEMTHDDVSQKAEITRQYYGMIEAGLRNPSVDLAKRIAKILNFEWTIFFEDKGNETFPDNISEQGGDLTGKKICQGS
jgi:putative transcriptional regulator